MEYFAGCVYMTAMQRDIRSSSAVSYRVTDILFTNLLKNQAHALHASYHLGLLSVYDKCFLKSEIL